MKPGIDSQQQVDAPRSKLITARDSVVNLVRPFYACWKRLVVCPPFQQSKDYCDATCWLGNEFQPGESTEGYGKVLTYAWRQYEQISSASDTLDKKADNLMRNAGLVAGLLGLAMNTIRIDHPQWLIPSLVK